LNIVILAHVDVKIQRIAVSTTGNWAETAVSSELATIAEQAPHNICKPGSPFFVSLLKVASIVKGNHMSSVLVLAAIKRTCAPLTWVPQRQIDYQWKRAYAVAEPRFPQ
jgi:hypothetical protein